MFNKRLILGLFVFVFIASVVAGFDIASTLVITIDDPVDGSWYNSSIDHFDWSVVFNDGGNITDCWYFVNGDRTNMTDCGVTTVPITPITQGIDHRIWFYAKNTAGNQHDYFADFSIDTTPPTTSDDFVNDDVWVNVNQTISLIEDCDLSGCAWTRFCTDATDTCNPSTDYTIPVVISTEGITYFRYASLDNAGNLQATVSRTVKIDKTAPVVDAGADVITNVQVLQDATVDGSVSGVASYLWTGAAEINFGTASAEDTTIDATTDGNYVIRLTVVDNAGNSNFDEINFVWDVTDPVTTDDAPVGWQLSDVTVTLTPIDATSGVADTLYCVDQIDACVPGVSGTSVLVSVEAVNYVRYYSLDNAGNDEDVNSVNVSVDKTAPTITDDFADDGVWINANQTVTLDPQDAVSGIKEVKYCEGIGCSPDVVLVSLYELNYNTDQDTIVRYQTFDNADNPSLIGEYNVKLDKTNPTTGDDYVNDDVWVNTNQTINLTPNCDISGCVSTKYCLTAECDPDTDYVAPVVISNEGTTVFRYDSEDNAGNVQDTVERSVMIDKTNPVTTSSLISEEEYTVPAKITLTCVDGGSGCGTVLYCFASTNDCVPTTEYSGEIEISNNGVWWVRFRSNDVAGNLEDIQDANNNATINIPPPSGSPSSGGGSYTPSFVENITEEEEKVIVGDVGEIVEEPVEENIAEITGAVVGGGDRSIAKDIITGGVIIAAAGLCIFLYRRWWTVKNNLPGSKKQP